MKKSALKWLLLGISVISLLFLLSIVKDNSSDPIITSEQKYQQKFIILDSVDHQFIEKYHIQYMDESVEPAPIPNFDLDQPVVITKMPVVVEKEKKSNEDKLK